MRQIISYKVEPCRLEDFISDHIVAIIGATVTAVCILILALLIISNPLNLSNKEFLIVIGIPVFMNFMTAMFLLWR